MNKVLVLMSTYNGEQYLKTQIDSILDQKNIEVFLLVRDDGSVDRTKEILNEYEKSGCLKWYTGENLRPAKSFMNLLQIADNSYDFYAFCDQDDFWKPNKLEVAIVHLKDIQQDKPALYYSRTTLVDSNLAPLKNTKHSDNYQFTTLSQAVVASNATGCTMCFNLALKKIMNLYEPQYQIMHDGWVHKVCLAVGGEVYYDHNSYILYRQHNNNVVGGTTTPIKRWKRRLNRIKKNPCPRSRGVAEILKGYENLMPDENKKICMRVAQYKESMIKRLNLFFGKEIHSTNKRVDFMFRVTVLFGIF